MASAGKRTRFCCVLLAGIFMMSAHGPAMAQGDAVTGSVVDAMARMLALTVTQIKQVSSVVREYVRQVDVLKADGVTEEALKARMKSLRDEMDEELARYLTEDQMAMWKGQEAEASQERARTVSEGSRRTLTRSVDIPAVKPRVQKDNGVLQSGSERKASGIW